jgi:hypothetical protein
VPRSAWLSIAPTSRRWGCVDVAVGVEQHGGGGARGLERPCKFRIDPTDLVQQLRCAAQLACDVHADVGGGGQPPVAVRAERTELGRPRQRRDAGHHVTPGKDAICCLFEQDSDVFIGRDRCLGEMPRTPVGLIGPQFSQYPICPAPLVCRGQLDHGRANQWVPESRPVGASVEVDQARLFGRIEVA